MGLDTTHDCWHGAYSSFSYWRNLVATAAGRELYEGGYWTPGWEDLPNLADKIQGRWSEPPADPLLVLLIHSDCDGIIPTELCAALADRLEKLVPLMPDDDAWGGWGPKTQEFVDGLRAAYAAGEDVEFH